LIGTAAGAAAREPGDPNMIRTVLATTAFIALLATGALAQPADAGAAAMPLGEATLTADDIKGIGVFGQDGEQIGTIGDLVVNPDGGIDAVIVDVGGFLGVGSKPVAVGFDNLKFSVDADNQRYLFLNATRQQLQDQPQFDKATYPKDRNAQRMVVNPNG